jgi:hypothetical protein
VHHGDSVLVVEVGMGVLVSFTTMSGPTSVSDSSEMPFVSTGVCSMKLLAIESRRLGHVGRWYLSRSMLSEVEALDAYLEIISSEPVSGIVAIPAES